MHGRNEGELVCIRHLKREKNTANPPEKDREKIKRERMLI